MSRYLCAIFIALLVTPSVHAQESEPLSLATARTLALAHQPLLQAQSAAVVAARQSAIASGQLPDPVLSGGLTDLTITGSDRYTLRNESDTQFQAGIKQQFFGGDKRKLRSQRANYVADGLDAELEESRRMIAREAGMGWIDVWKALRAQSVVEASIAQAKLQEQTVMIAYTNNRASQAEVLTARVAVELLNDQLASFQQMEWHARNQLRRWIGDAAERPLQMNLPDWPTPNLDQMLTHLANHPHVQIQSAAVEVAKTSLDLAQANYSPDYSVMAGYGYRPGFADYASITFEIDLPFFTANRQDRGVAAASSQLNEADQKREDWLKQHRAEITLNVSDWNRLQERFIRYDTAILPQAQNRMEAALAAYSAGQGSLTAVLDARRSLLDIRMQRLDLEADSARHQISLAYFNHEASAPAGDQP
jgi:outer membrane protein TolC